MSHLKIRAWGLEKMMARVQAVTTISRARLLCAAQLRDSSGDWMVISLGPNSIISNLNFIVAASCVLISNFLHFLLGHF